MLPPFPYTPEEVKTCHGGGGAPEIPAESDTASIIYTADDAGRMALPWQ